MSGKNLSTKLINKYCRSALKEDLYPSGDITSKLIKNKKKIKAKLIINEPAIIGGLEFAKQTFKLVDRNIKFIIKKKEGSFIKKGSVAVIIQGDSKSILTGERTALNFISHISGIATKTNLFVKASKTKNCKICCTRKTIPNLRSIQKYAVKLGGGLNHRFNLSDEYLIKDNHIISSNIKELVNKAIRNRKGKKITVEIDKIEQLKKILGLKFDRVLFDNMSVKNLKKGIKIVNKLYETEASGNITLEKIKKIAATGVNRISIGSITHSAPSIDCKLEI